MTASREHDAAARSITVSVRPPHAWIDTTTSSFRNGTCGSDVSRWATRPSSFGHAAAIAAASVGHDGGNA
jgi:hypothetical protein